MILHAKDHVREHIWYTVDMDAAVFAPLQRQVMVGKKFTCRWVNSSLKEPMPNQNFVWYPLATPPPCLRNEFSAFVWLVDWLKHFTLPSGSHLTICAAKASVEIDWLPCGFSLGRYLSFAWIFAAKSSWTYTLAIAGPIILKAAYHWSVCLHMYIYVRVFCLALHSLTFRPYEQSHKALDSPVITRSVGSASVDQTWLLAVTNLNSTVTRSRGTLRVAFLGKRVKSPALELVRIVLIKFPRPFKLGQLLGLLMAFRFIEQWFWRTIAYGSSRPNYYVRAVLLLWEVPSNLHSYLD